MMATYYDAEADGSTSSGLKIVDEPQELAVKYIARRSHGVEGLSPSKPMNRFQETTVAFGSCQFLFVTHGELPTPFRPSACKHAASGLCFHSGAKPVGVLSLPDVGLKRPLHSDSPVLRMISRDEKKEGHLARQSSRQWQFGQAF